MPTRRTSRRRAPARRRPVQWFDQVVNESTASGTQDTTLLTGGITDIVKKGMTLVRTIIDMTSVLSIAGTGGLMHYGIAMVSDEAVASGAFPDADSASDEPGWIWRVMGRVIASTNLNDISMNSRLVYDIKSRRMFKTQDWDLYLIIDAGTLSDIVNTDGMIRTLWQKA